MFFKIKFWRKHVLFVRPLTPLFGDVYPGIESQGGSLTCTWPHLHAIDSSDLPLVWHLPTSWQLARQPVAFPIYYICSIHRISHTVSRRAFHSATVTGLIWFTVTIGDKQFTMICKWSPQGDLRWSNPLLCAELLSAVYGYSGATALPIKAWCTHVTSGEEGLTPDCLHRSHAMELLRYGGCVPPLGLVRLWVF